MSDPHAATQANSHPVSGHRTPSEIAEDEAGPIGQTDTDVVGKDDQSGKSPRSVPQGVDDKVPPPPQKDGRSMPDSA